MNRNSKSVLMRAVTEGTFQEVKDAFNQHDLIFDDSYFDYKLLQAGLSRRHQCIIHYLINKVGCRAGKPNNDKLEETPLHLAMDLNNEYIIKKVLNKGASIFDKDDEGDIPLYAAFKNGNLTAVRTLLTHCKPKVEPQDKNALLHFHIACATNHIPAAKHYINCGVNPNCPFSLDYVEYSGLNSVQFAAEKDYYDLFRILLHRGADLSVKNAKELSPIHIIYYSASKQDRKYRIKEIFQYGNDTKFVNLVDGNRMSHFHFCCMLNEPDFVQKFINNGVNVNRSVSLKSSINPGFTPLHFAVINGNEKVVELLLKNGADCNKKDKEGRTPLHFTCKISGYWKTPIVKMLLDYKANPAIVDNQGNTAIHMEFCKANSENKNLLDMLFSKISKKNNSTNADGLSHFHIACTINNIRRVKDFLNSGVQVDSCVASGIYHDYRALHFAVLHNQRKIVKLLLKKNAQVNFKAEEISLMHLACESNYAKFSEENPNYKLEDFKPFPIDLTSLSNRTNQIDIINLLIEHGAHVDVINVEGMTPLLHACTLNRHYCQLNWCYNSFHLSRLEKEGLIKEIKIRLVDIIEILISNKVNVNVCSNQQESLLHIICKYNTLKIPENLIKSILTKGIDINGVNNMGLTPLHIAVREENSRMARILLRNKANVNIKCKDSQIPLHTVFERAIRDKKEEDIFSSLLESGSSVDVIAGEGDKVMLHVAIYSQYYAVVSKLLHYGADINMEDSQGNSCVSPLLEWDNGLANTGYDNYHYGRVFEIVYIHVQKLLALGLYVSKKVQKCCNRLYQFHREAALDDNELINLSNIFNDCLKELERLKLEKIDNYTSLYSILLKDQHELSKHVKNNNLIKTVKSRNLEEDFPLYHYLLKLQFKKGTIRSDLLQYAKPSLTTVIKVDLPDLCLELIIKYLNNEDVYNLKAAALLMKELKRKALKRKLEATITPAKQLKEDETPKGRVMLLRSSVKKITKKV